MVFFFNPPTVERALRTVSERREGGWNDPEYATCARFFFLNKTKAISTEYGGTNLKIYHGLDKISAFPNVSKNS